MAETLVEVEVPRAQSPSEFLTCSTDLAKQFADLYSANMESPWEYWYFAYLTFFGAYASGLVTLRSEIDIQPRLYTVLLGPSADPRKSTVLKKADALFASLQAPVVARTLYGAGSAEGLGKALNTTPRVVLVYDELKSFVDVAKRDGSVLLPMVNTLFESNTYGNETKVTSLAVKDARLVVAAASTLETYGTMFGKEFMNIGLPNRLWLVPGERTKDVPWAEPVDPAVLGALADLTRDRLKSFHHAFVVNGGRPVAYSLSAQAKLDWANWYKTKPRGESGRRLDTYGARLMLLLTLVRGEIEVTADIVADVVKMLAWQVQARREHDPIDADGKVAVLEELIRRKVEAHAPLTKRELATAVHAWRVGHWAFNTALKNCMENRDVALDAQNRVIRADKGAATPAATFAAKAKLGLSA